MLLDMYVRATDFCRAEAFAANCQKASAMVNNYDTVQAKNTHVYSAVVQNNIVMSQVSKHNRQ